MAMHQPSSRIIRLESDYQPAGAWKHGNVATRRVDEVKRRHTTASKGAGGYGAEDGKVVAVDVDRMRNPTAVLNYPEGPLVVVVS